MLSQTTLSLDNLIAGLIPSEVTVQLPNSSHYFLVIVNKKNLIPKKKQ